MTLEFESVRSLALQLPEVTEGTWYGSPSFRVGRKVFARLHENDPDLVLIKVGPLERDYLVASSPHRFLRTDHRSETEDAVLMRLSASEVADLAELAELIEGAWRRIAPQRLLGLDGRDT